MSRQSEVRLLEDLVAAVRGGRSRSLVVVGPAGTGKSWLCRRASTLADGFTVVATRGVQSEAHLESLTVAGLDTAEAVGLVDCGLARLEAGQPRFSHPLAQAAVLEIAVPAQRRLAHAALARAWGEAGEPERSAWHLAEAGDGPDARVSSALAGVARAARARGAPGAAAEAWRMFAFHAHAGQGLLELGLDHPDAAITHLSCAREIAERGGIAEPNYVQFMPDLIESQIRAGLEPDARETLAEFEAQAQKTGRRGAAAPRRPPRGGAPTPA